MGVVRNLSTQKPGDQRKPPRQGAAALFEHRRDTRVPDHPLAFYRCLLSQLKVNRTSHMLNATQLQSWLNLPLPNWRSFARAASRHRPLSYRHQ